MSEMPKLYMRGGVVKPEYFKFLRGISLDYFSYHKKGGWIRSIKTVGCAKMKCIPAGLLNEVQQL